MAPLMVVLFVGLVIRLTFIQSAGYRDDMTIFYGWFRSISELPPSQVYAHIPGLNYPPAYVVLSELSAVVLRFVVHGSPSEYALNVALKLPPILFDIGGAVLAYCIVRRYANHALGLAAAAFISFNPAFIYDSAYWGQNDSVPTVLALLAIFALSSRYTIVAWLAITLASLVKPPVLVLVPLMLLHPFAVQGSRRRRRLWEMGFGVASALVLAEVLAVAFFPNPNLIAAPRHLIGQLVSGARLFGLNSLNAFNIWALFQPFFLPDKTRFLFLSLHLWGSLLFCATAALIYWGYVRSRDALALYEASALVLLAFFLCLTEMHERYLYYAVVFTGALLFRKRYRYAAVILSVTLLLNLEYGLTFMYLDDARATMVNRYEFAPWLVHLCAGANVGVFVWLLLPYLRLRQPPIKFIETVRSLFANPASSGSQPGIVRSRSAPPR